MTLVLDASAVWLKEFPKTNIYIEQQSSYKKITIYVNAQKNEILLIANYLQISPEKSSLLTHSRKSSELTQFGPFYIAQFRIAFDTKIGNSIT